MNEKQLEWSIFVLSPVEITINKGLSFGKFNLRCDLVEKKMILLRSQQFSAISTDLAFFFLLVVRNYEDFAICQGKLLFGVSVQAQKLPFPSARIV